MILLIYTVTVHEHFLNKLEYVATLWFLSCIEVDHMVPRSLAIVVWLQPSSAPLGLPYRQLRNLSHILQNKMVAFSFMINSTAGL